MQGLIFYIAEKAMRKEMRLAAGILMMAVRGVFAADAPAAGTQRVIARPVATAPGVVEAPVVLPV